MKDVVSHIKDFCLYSKKKKNENLWKDVYVSVIAAHSCE